MKKKRVKVKYMMREEWIAWYQGTEASEIETQMKLLFGLKEESKVVLLHEGSPIEVSDHLQEDIVYELRELGQRTIADLGKAQGFSMNTQQGGGTPKLPMSIINNQGYADVQDPSMMSPANYMFQQDMKSPIGVSPVNRIDYMGNQAQFGAQAAFANARYGNMQESQGAFRSITNSHVMDGTEGGMPMASVNSSRDNTPRTNFGMSGNTPYAKSPNYNAGNLSFHQYFEMAQNNAGAGATPGGNGTGVQNGSSTPSNMGGFQGAMNAAAGMMANNAGGGDTSMMDAGAGGVSTPSNYSFNAIYNGATSRGMGTPAGGGTNTSFGAGSAIPGSTPNAGGFSHFAQMSFTDQSPGGMMRNSGMYMYNNASPFNSVMGHAGTPLNGMAMTPNGGLMGGTGGQEKDDTPSNYLSLDTPHNFRMGDSSPQLQSDQASSFHLLQDDHSDDHL